MKRKLEKMKEDLQNAGEGAVPNWVQAIDNVAKSSQTLRIKMIKQQKDNPDKLSFRERMLFFAASTIEKITKKNQILHHQNQKNNFLFFLTFFSFSFCFIFIF